MADTSELKIGTFVQAVYDDGFWRGVVAQTFPNNQVLILITNTQYRFVPVTEVREVSDDEIPPESASFHFIRELREEMGLKAD